MSPIPPTSNNSAHSRSRSVPTARTSANGGTIPVNSRELSVPSTTVNRRTNNVASNRQLSRISSSPPAAKSRAAIDDETVSQWLGGSDFSDAPSIESPVQSAANSASGPETSQGVSDTAVLARIADRLVERNIPSFQRIGLDMKNGIITVRGTVASKGERLLLIHILRTTPGVRMVQDGLVMTGSRSSRWKLSDLLDSIPALPEIASMASFRDAFSSVKPVHAAVVMVLLGIAGIFFWPRGVSRPVAVYPLKGRVVLDGEPLAEATVVLHPTGDSKLPSGILPRGTAEANGDLVFKTFDSADGSPEGDFVATVHLMKPVVVEGDLVPGPDLSPAVYRTPETSPFRVTITRETREISLLELRKPAGNGSRIH